MSTYHTDNPIPPELAKRLALEYMNNPRGALAALYWTGATPPVAKYWVKDIREEMLLSPQGIDDLLTDQHAFEANFRALYGYIEEHAGRSYTRDWNFIQSWGDVADQVIPWNYRSGWEPLTLSWEDYCASY